MLIGDRQAAVCLGPNYVTAIPHPFEQVFKSPTLQVNET